MAVTDIQDVTETQTAAVAATAETEKQPEVPPEKRLLFCILTEGRPDASLGFCVAMLKYQVAICSTDLMVDLLHFKDLDEALNAFAASPHEHGFFVNGSVSFDPELPIKALKSQHDAVVGCYPLPGLDWAAVKAGKPGEDPKTLATTHNVEVEEDAEYATVTRLRHLGALYLSKKALGRIAESAPRHATGWLFFAPGIFDGQLETAERRFMRMLGAPPKADMTRLCGYFGPQEFAGSIAYRTQVR